MRPYFSIVDTGDRFAIGGWWGSDPQGEHCQPEEFLLDIDGKILESLYASEPIGRMNASEVIKIIKFIEMRRINSKLKQSSMNMRSKNQNF